MKNLTAWLVLVLLLAGAGAYYYHSKKQAAATPPPPPAPEIAQNPAPPPIQHPIEAAQTGEPAAAAGAAGPLPALADSDAAAQESLQGLFGTGALGNFYLMEIVRHIVATVDNLPRDRVARRLMPLKPVPGTFAVSGTGDNRVIGPGNSARYAAYVKLVQAVDTQKLVAAYVHFYPLFQQAYVELGYPNGYFNDRLISVIDDLLSAPEVAGPIRLSEPSVLYRYADPDLEGLSAGQKILLRMGPDNARVVKAKLREIKSALIGGVPKAQSEPDPGSR